MIKFVFLSILLFLEPNRLFASEIAQIKIPLDYRLIRNLLIQQLYTQQNETARLWQEGQDCSYLDISNPQISGENGQVKIENQVHAKIGLQLGHQCIKGLQWEGKLLTLQQPTLDNSGRVLSLPVTSVQASDEHGQLNIKKLQDLISSAIESKLTHFKLDLNLSQSDIVKKLQPFMDIAAKKRFDTMLSTAYFAKVDANDNALVVDFNFKNPKQDKAQVIQSEAVLTEEEIRKWDLIWDQFLINLKDSENKTRLSALSDSDKKDLDDILQNATNLFRQGLTQESPDAADPVKFFFDDSWQKILPLLIKSTQKLTDSSAADYLTLISVTDQITKIDTISRSLGFEISTNGLRKVVRSYLKNLNTL